MSVTKLLFDDRIKPKNVLALNEKVAAIRRYEVDPVYKKIGRMFNCSPDQIKRIIKQKNEILAEWENRTRKPNPPTSHEIKTVKISFLGKAVHEWIRRIMYYTDFNLNDTLIQTMSLEFSKALKLANFYPTAEWISNFRATYNLPDANTKTMSIGYQESHSVQIRDILSYVKEVYGTKDVGVDDDQSNSASASTNTTIRTTEIPEVIVEEIKQESDNSNLSSDFVMKIKEEEEEEEENCQPSCSTIQQTQEIPEQRTVLNILNTEMPMQIDSEATDYQPLLIQPQITNNDHEPVIKSEENEKEEEQQPELELEPEREPEPELELELEPEPKRIAIFSHDAAISCVKLLEEFALLKENFRLIGLIERLEEAMNEQSE